MIIEKKARPTLTAIELDVGDELRFTLCNGQTRSIVLKQTKAFVFHTNVNPPGKKAPGGFLHYRFGCTFSIDGVDVSIMREVGTQKSFYQPRELFGLRIWLDACDDIFNFLPETHGECRPRRKARLALQDASLRICPTLLHPWCPLPKGTLRIEDCYNGDDCWLGAYFGVSVHAGLDINHPAGTPLWSPIEIDDQSLFTIEGAKFNNRWRGFHLWPDGSVWVLQSHHLIRMLVPEHQSIPAGTQYAEGAGMAVGDHEHSHFVFKVREPDTSQSDEILLDPWILFWQMYRDRQMTTAK